MPKAESKEAFVIGAGLVGICTALALQEKGFAVSLIDRDGAAEGTSFGNAGVISPWSCVPQSLPGILKNLPNWLLDPEGPLALRWPYIPQLMPWMLKFLQAGALSRLPAIADAMLAVNRPNLDMYHQLLAGSGNEALVQDCLYLHAYRSADGANLDDLSWRLRRDRGVELRVLRGGEIREVEPELTQEIKSAVVITRQGRTVNPGRLGKVLAAKAKALGVKFLRGRVDQIVPETNGSYRIETDQGGHVSKTVVLAAGAWSVRLLAALGIPVSLEAERGYHLVFKNPKLSLKNSIMDADRKFVTSSMEMGIRSAGTAEFGGLESTPNYRRAKMFTKLAKDLLPNLNTEATEEWSGVRPSTPDSVPYIGATPGHPRLFCAFGHGHLGLTGAPMTGRMIAALAAGVPLNIDLTPYRLDRFNG